MLKNEPCKFFKGCLPQILLGPFLDTLSHMMGIDDLKAKSISENLYMYISNEDIWLKNVTSLAFSITSWSLIGFLQDKTNQSFAGTVEMTNDLTYHMSLLKLIGFNSKTHLQYYQRVKNTFPNEWLFLFYLHVFGLLVLINTCTVYK